MPRYADADKLMHVYEKMMREPSYQHEGEDWRVGIIMCEQALAEQSPVDVVDKERYNRLLENSAIIADALSKYQSADMVEVVMCKDCKHGREYKHTKEYVECKVDCEPIDRDSDFYCKYGERRDNECTDQRL